MTDFLLAFFDLRGKQIVVVVIIGVIVFLLTSPRKSGRRCKNCQEFNPSYAQFCSQCGRNLKRK